MQFNFRVWQTLVVYDVMKGWKEITWKIETYRIHKTEPGLIPDAAGDGAGDVPHVPGQAHLVVKLNF